MTKIKELTGSPVRVLVVDVPEYAQNISLTFNNDAIVWLNPETGKLEHVYLPADFKWTILTTDLKNISEDEAARVSEQAVKLIRKINPEPTDVVKFKKGFKNYVYGNDICDTATESLHSLLKANGVLLENPYGEKCPELKSWFNPNTMTTYDNHEELEQWHSAEANVFRNPVLLIEKK